METIMNHIADRGLSIAAMLHAPVDLVWEAWTNPGQIANWWGPNGFANTIHTMNVEEGGEWRLTMHGPDGKNYPNKSIFEKVVPLKKIVLRHFNPDYVATIAFEPKGNETLLKWEMLFETAELFETVVKVFKADEGLQQNVEKLEHYLQQRKQ